MAGPDDLRSLEVEGKRISRVTPIMFAALLLVIFGFDYVTPLGVAGGVLYVLPVWLAANSDNLRLLQGTVTVSVILTIVAYFVSPDAGGTEAWKVIANRALAIFAIFMVAGKDLLFASPTTSKNDSFPTLVYAAPLLTLVIVVVSTWSVYAVLSSSNREMEVERDLSDMHRNIMQYNTILTNSTRMAILTGEQSWFDRYDEYEQKLGRLLTRTYETDATASLEAISEIKKANDMLLALENRAFDHAESGQASIALQILDSKEYVELKQKYANGLHSFLGSKMTESNRKRRDHEHRSRLLLAANIIAGIMCFAIWAATIRSFLRWRESEAKHTEQLERYANDLESRNVDLKNFAYAASHDLKSPLRAIENLAHWVSDDLNGSIPEESAAHLKLIGERIVRMDNLLDGLLAFAVASRDDGDIREIEAIEIVRKVIADVGAPDSMQIIASGSVPKFQTRISPLELCLRNLISNAVKHHDRESGLINVEISQRNGMVEFAVTDDGPGISPEDHTKIFELFKTLKRRDELESTGVGLALVKKAAQANGAHVEVESSGDRGTTFKLIWPLGLSVKS